MADDHTPKISIVVAAYGQEPYIAELIASLKAQTVTDWEAIIVDDGSTDGVLARAGEAIGDDNRFRLLHTQNQGVAAARNAGFNIARGEFFLSIDADDLIAPHYLEKTLKALEADPKMLCAFTDVEGFGARTFRNRVAYTSFPGLLISNPLYNAALMRASRFREIGGFDPQFSRGLDDWEFWIRFLDGVTPKRLKHIPGFDFRYRQKEQSITTNLDRQTELMEHYKRLILEKHHDKYARYFGIDIQTWMLQSRNYRHEIRFLLRREHQHEIRREWLWPVRLRKARRRIAQDASLSLPRRLILLEAIERLWQ